MPDFDWTPQSIDQLRQLWAAGLTLAEIGRQFGISRGAVSAMVYRLGLPGRRAYKRPESPRLSRSRRKPQPFASPRLDSAAPEANSRVGPGNIVPGTLSEAQPNGCCWPLGEPGSDSFRFCDDPPPGGELYCHTHRRSAYVAVAASQDEGNDEEAKPSSDG